MNITVLGSCRVDGIKGNNNLNNQISYCHTAKESINLISYINNKTKLDYPYNMLCFRTGILNGNPILAHRDMQQKLNTTNLFIVEICSSKLYMHNDIVLHHLAVDKKRPKYHIYTPKSILEEYTVRKQTDTEIYQDIKDLLRIIGNKKILIVSHINAKKQGAYLSDRAKLICLLENICRNLDIPFYNPSKFIDICGQNNILYSDLGHYTSFGRKIIKADIQRFIKENFNAI